MRVLKFGTSLDSHTKITGRVWCMTAVSVKIRPLRDRVLVKALSRETVTKSGIVLPDTATVKPQEVEILATGPGNVLDNSKRTTLEVSVVLKVMFTQYA